MTNRLVGPSMTEDSGGSDGDGSNNSDRLLSGKKAESVRANAAQKDASTDALSEIAQKSGGKEPQGGEAPSAEGQNIPSSVDPDAPTSTEGGGDE